MSIRALDAEGRYSFLWESPLTWLNNLGFVQFGDFGYFLTTPQKTEGTVFLNSTSDVFPIAYSLVGAGLVAYVGESQDCRDESQTWEEDITCNLHNVHCKHKHSKWKTLESQLKTINHVFLNVLSIKYQIAYI